MKRSLSQVLVGVSSLLIASLAFAEVPIEGVDVCVVGYCNSYRYSCLHLSL